jgi:hypothetical protein
MKDVISILSYCDNERKLNILIKNIKILKQRKIPIALHANFALPEYVQKMVDHYFCEDLNVVFPNKSTNCWYVDKIFKRKFTSILPDYGFSVFLQIKKMSEYLSFDYDRMLLINYDVVLSDIIFRDYYDNLEFDIINYYFGEKSLSLILMFFDIKKFVSNINKHLDYGIYNNLTNMMTEQKMYKFISESGMNNKIIKRQLGDYINELYYEDNKNDFFNKSIITHNVNKLTFYIWISKLYSITINVDGCCYELSNDILDVDRFLSTFIYNETIKNINIIKIEDTVVDIPLIIKNVIVEKI